MSYSRLNLTDGVDRWTATHVSHLEDGIVANEEALAQKQPIGEYLKASSLRTINGQSLVGSGDIKIEGTGEVEVTDEYSELRYIGNNGSQWIDTGYVVNENDIITVDYEIPSDALSISTDKIILDARDNANGLRVSTWGANYKWYFRFGHNAGTTTAAYTNKHQSGSFEVSKGKLVINGTTVCSDTPFTAMPTGTLKFLSGVNPDGTQSAPSYARILKAKITRDGQTIKNYLPYIRNIDNEPGLRELVDDEFLTNAGSGTFTYEIVETSSGSSSAAASTKKPTLTTAQKQAIQQLMDDYYNNKGTFYYEFTHNRNAFASSSCYTTSKEKFKMCCATFVQNIMMGRDVNDFVGKTGATYSPTITRTAVSDFGYYFDFKYRKYLYGLTDTDDSGNTTYYGYVQPNADSNEGSYSYNSYYHPDSTQANQQDFNGFCNANDMARELYEMGCEIPFSELDIGDIVFTCDNDLSDNSSMFNFSAWRNIYHVAMVYDVKQIDASSKEIYYIECTSYFDVDNRPIEKPHLASEQMDLRFKGFKLTEDMVFCARLPVAFGYTPNVPQSIGTSPTP